MKDFSQYEYLICDVTGHEHCKSPVQNTGLPLYLGLGVRIPEGDFTSHGPTNRAIQWTVVSVLDAGDPLNPFGIDVVLSRRGAQ